MILRVICFGLSLLAANAAQAQQAAGKSDVSDKTLRTLKSMAWESLPSKIKRGDKTEVVIDKSDSSKIIIPDPEAREIVKAAYLTARAHRCDMQELVVANRDAILSREKQKNKWNESQLQYINALHLYTVQLLVGKVQASDGSKPKADYDSKTLVMPESGTVACSDKEKQDISAAVEANYKQVRKS